jgi:hypothetical protein
MRLEVAQCFMDFDQQYQHDTRYVCLHYGNGDFIWLSVKVSHLKVDEGSNIDVPLTVSNFLIEA